MKKFFEVLGAGLLFAGCGGATDGNEQQTNSDQGGGSMTGAGGAGPGYDGSAAGTGKYGTIPDGGTNRTAGTNVPMPRTDTAPPQIPVPPSPGQPR